LVQLEFGVAVREGVDGLDGAAANDGCGHCFGVTSCHDPASAQVDLYPSLLEEILQFEARRSELPPDLTAHTFDDGLRPVEQVFDCMAKKGTPISASGNSDRPSCCHHRDRITGLLSWVSIIVGAFQGRF
jgi:hypothetical protein